MAGNALDKVQPSSAIEEFMREFGNAASPVGLEDVGSDDLALAVIKIDHAEAVFVDSLTGEKFPEIDGVLLGLLKQRVLWDPDPDAKTGPLCKSKDSKVGSPRDAFPWDEYRKNGGTAPTGSDSIECGTCALAKWGSHPNNDTPWCSAQYAFPVVIGDADTVSGLLSFQRSGIAPCKSYISGFVRDRMPLFAYRTKISLDQNRKGTVKFCTPVFSRGAAVDDAGLLRVYAEQFQSIRSVVQQVDVSDSTVVTGTPVPPVIDGEVVSETTEFAPEF